MPSKGWIGVDLDGTLAEYNGWEGVEHVGKPIPKMVNRVKKWLAKGEDVRIFTARVDGGEVAISMGNPLGKKFREVDKVKRVIEKWCQKHIGVVLPITNRKDYGMKVLYDDRCRRVEFNTGRILG